MINCKYHFEDLHNMVSVWVPDGLDDTAELARVADYVVHNGIRVVSVGADDVKKIWPWLENSGVKILSRFLVDEGGKIDDVISGFAKMVTDVVRHGADGVQVFIPCSCLGEFVRELEAIRDDLFFDKILSVGLDIEDVVGGDWLDIFAELARICPGSILICGDRTGFDAKSDFVGRIYDMLKKWNLDSDINMMFCGNMLRVAQVIRLVRGIRPELNEKMRVFAGVDDLVA